MDPVTPVAVVTQPVWWVVLVAAASMFVLGGLWYSPALFGRAWMRLHGFTEEGLRAGGGVGRIFGGAFVLALLSAANLAFFVAGHDFSFCLFAGAATGIGFVSTALGITYLFERKPLRLWLINAGYHAVAFTLMGAILGALGSVP